jgi:catechol 2,3-dioxygenase-like lactoylglutathione lyase family enzyme
MPLSKVWDIAYGRLRAPDLDAMEEFLTNFGLVRAARTKDALYMRGTDGDPHIHITEKGDPGFIGLAYNVASEDDLKALASAPGASGIENLDEPGGGKRVRLTEPNGYQIEVIYGQEPLDPIPVSFQKLNSGAEGLNRAGELMRIHTGPSRVKRIGHAVLGSPHVMETVKWFRETLGFVRSDDVYAGEKDNIIGSFNRVDQGDAYVDHHVFFCVRNERAGLNHLSFEVHDLDDVFTGHEHLQGVGGYEQVWGLGRHLLGSQVFDYWADPWGNLHEHWADSDRLNLGDGGNLIAAEEGLKSQWGEGAPERFVRHVTQ